MWVLAAQDAFVSFRVRLKTSDNVEMNRVYPCSAQEIESDRKWKEVYETAEKKENLPKG